MNKFKVGDKVKYEWALSGIYVSGIVIALEKVENCWFYTLNIGAYVPEDRLLYD